MPSGWRRSPWSNLAPTGRGQSRSAPTRAYDTEDFVNELRSMKVTPHVAQNTAATFGDRRADDAASGYAVSQRIRKRIEEAFGWIKTGAGQQKTGFRGMGRVGFAFAFAAAAYSLVRLPKLLAGVSI